MNDIHPGDKVLSAVLRLISGLYGGPRDRTESRLNAFLKPKFKALQRKDETLTSWMARVQSAFSGPLWLLVRRRIASDYTSANEKANDYINSALAEAFAEGMNESAYTLALSGAATWPITPAIVTSLVSARVVTLRKRVLKKNKGIKYNEERLQSAINAVMATGAKVEDMPRLIAEHMTRARQSEITSFARVQVYSASDEGAYYAGIEAEKAGLDIEKTWLAIMDMRVRPSHKHLHGTTIPLSEKFHGYYGNLRFPHDQEAPPAEIYHCRCRMTVHLAGKSPGEYSRRILPTETSAYRKWRDAQIRKAGGEIELAKLHKRKLG